MLTASYGVLQHLLSRRAYGGGWTGSGRAVQQRHNAATKPSRTAVEQLEQSYVSPVVATIAAKAKVQP